MKTTEKGIFDLTRLFRTTAVRIGLRYAAVYALLAGAALGAFYWSSGRYIDAQLRTGLKEDFNTLLQEAGRNGMRGLIEAVDARSHGGLRDQRYYLLTDGDGNKLAGNLKTWPPETDILLDGEVHTTWVEDDAIPGDRYDDDAYWPLVATRLADGSRLLVARGVRQAEQLELFSEASLLSLLVVIVVLALAMAIYIGMGMLRRIDAITATSRKIMAGDLSQRIPLSGRDDEFDELAHQLNSMLDRINQLLEGMREVTDNIAHDLRSPLTRLRNRLEVTLLEKRSEREYRQAMEDAIRDADNLVRTFNTLLHIGQADAGTARAAMTRVDLAAIAVEIGEFYKPLAEQKGQRISVQVPEGGVAMVNGNRDLLAQAIGNLLDNAIKYSPAGGQIVLAVETGEEEVRLSVSDQGPGVPHRERSRVVERFVRLDGARSKPGNGLGLSLVDAIARQHGAILSLEDNRPGLRAILTFPLPETPP